MTSPDVPGDGRAADLLASALAETRRARDRLQAGETLELDRLSASIERLEQVLAGPAAGAGPAIAGPLIALLDEVGGLVRAIETARAAVGMRLATDRRLRQAGSAYRRLGRR
jgi:hypothetical protein